MNIFIQIVCFLVSFLYGIFIYYFIKYNDFNKKNILFDVLFRLIITFLLVLLYIIVIYKINKGLFHLYFMIMIVIGYLVSFNINKKLK